MSFGYSVGDAVLLTQVAWKTLQNTRKACGEHDELTREVLSLHIVLQRLEQEYSKVESPLNRSSDTYKEELQVIGCGCERVLGVLNTILKKYNRLSEEERSWRKLWQKITFGNGQVADLQDLRSKIVTYTSAMSLFLNMVSLGSVGRIEQQMTDAGGDLQEIKLAIHSIAAHLTLKDNNEGSVLTSYTNDDKSVWKEFRRELRREGFASSDLNRNKTLIVAYIRELGDRGLFDDDCDGDLKSVEDLEASNAHRPTKDVSGKNRPKSSAVDKTFLTVGSTSAVLQRESSASGIWQRPSLSADDITNTDNVSGNVRNARLPIKLSKGDRSGQSLAGTGMTSVSEAPTADSKALDGMEFPLERKPLQSYAESVADDEITEEFNDTESLPGSQGTPVNVSSSAATPTSPGAPSVDPIESVQTNHSATSSTSTRSQGSITRTPSIESMEAQCSITRTPSTEAMEVESTKYERYQSGPKISTFYVAFNGFCLAWDDLDASSLLDQFEDRVYILSGCRRIAWRFEARLNQFNQTAKAITSNLDAFLAALGPKHGSCKREHHKWGFIKPFETGIFSLSKNGFGDFEDLRDILINVCLWICRFDDNCGGIVFYYQGYLKSKTRLILQYPRNFGLRECWAMPNNLRSTTRSMEGTYQRPSYFSLNNEGPTPPEFLRKFRCLAEENQLHSSVPTTECRGRIGRYERPPAALRIGRSVSLRRLYRREESC